MKKTKFMKTLNIVAVLVVAFSTAAVVHAADSGKKNYNFEYSIKGQPSVVPVQVFDSGIDTYLQFAQDRTVPAIFAVSPCGTKVLLATVQDGQYIVVRGRYRKIALQMGGKTSTVEYAGKDSFPMEEVIPNEECDAPVTAKADVPAYRAYTAVPPTVGDDNLVLRQKKIDSSNSKTYMDGAWRVTAQPLLPNGQVAPDHAQVPSKGMKVAAGKPAAAKSKGKTNSKAGKSKTVAPVEQYVMPAVALPSRPAINPNPVVAQAAVPGQGQMAVVETWEIKPGESIRKSLESWCYRAGWQCSWFYDGDFIAQGGHTFKGDFPSAVRGLIAAIPESTNLKVELAENKLVYITRGIN